MPADYATTWNGEKYGTDDFERPDYVWPSITATYRINACDALEAELRLVGEFW